MAPPVKRLSYFTVISGIGWMIDIGLTLGLVAIGLAVTVANLVGATTAVSFVYVTAQRHIFDRNPTRFTPARRVAIYAGYQTLAITTASVLIGGLAWALRTTLAPTDPVLCATLAKIAVTPLTLYCNFVFTGWLIEGRLSWY